ncbi:MULTISPECIES: thioredoxin-dependent thiol peroxidase [unclassified Marinobacterium]|jgi:thioredoxin-dependent peroxiredoxin|uniref:thioredoxin-dependent thiol peroxidase n=1 Tax=unclassified Marinobacterium TaxID=2644139 RepID=UPI001569BDC7|nr:MULTISPECIES: thioredoxin-dependent thiol peroxidase [unclassified Marinobacterium]NRP09387.1 putative peroxiredoxin bcp [Marinobacterium sp. xm-g-48]NRP26727.1 putative peroxiredoxin bcp [Marinobacterium sp. xm-d-420]NRP46172.1 putative peroxiredoxin bcp [Marinobacterium sp. xm-d-543]NRP52847.1 putative peroxiredoxin bcp [Marinobacterium sp. xm-v-242]NRP56442.1 putative peroxiredoxin bcp [Marinobacterium sp. xm-d-510]
MVEVGQTAPDFEAKDQNGETITLSQYKGKKVVLYFYPRDNTPGCTAQACDLRDNIERLADNGYQVIGVSTDSEAKHRNFIEKYDLPFPLIADTDNAVHELYGTWQLKKNYGKEYMGTVRTTFIIDEQGKVSDVIAKVKTKEHTAQILGD